MLAKRTWILFFFVITCFYFWGLGLLPLVGPDEPRYAQVAREMLARRDFITPTLGGHPWFEKPPLLYWMTMASYRVLGVTEYAARLGPAICGLLTALFIYWMGKRIAAGESASDSNHGAARDRNTFGAVSALVWLSSLGAILFSRGASFDIVLTMTVTGALACFLVVELSASNPESRGGKRSALPLAGFYFFTGASLLAKGLIGFVIIFGVVGLYYLLRWELPSRRFAKSLLWGVPLALVTAAIWYVPMINLHGWTFVDQFIVQHHFARFTSNKFHHPGPFYFYIPVLIALTLPWTGILVAAFVSIRRWAWRGEEPVHRVRVLALVWLVFPVLCFSFSGSKLTAYILPVVPAAALLVGERIVCFIRMGRGQKVIRLTGLIMLASASGGAWYTHARLNTGWRVLAPAALILSIAGLVALFRARVGMPMIALIALATILTSAIAIRFISPQSASMESVRDLMTVAAARGYGSTRVVQLHTIQRTAEFYAADRLDYLSDGEPVKLEGAMQVADAARRNDGVILCLVPTQFESQLTTYQEGEAELIADNGVVALIAFHVRK